MPFGQPAIFEVEPLGKPAVAPTWSTPAAPIIDDAEAKKKLFGMELAKGQAPFEAACTVFPSESGKALWASREWINDPVVIGAKDAYTKSSEETISLLSKEELAIKVLKLSDLKSHENGKPLIDAKTKLDALRYYGELMNYTGKGSEPVGGVGRTDIATITFEFVEPEPRQPMRVITAVETVQSVEPLSDDDIELDFVEAEAS